MIIHFSRLYCCLFLLVYDDISYRFSLNEKLPHTPKYGVCVCVCVCVCTRACVLSRFSCVPLFATPWTIALQAPLSVGLSRQEHWSGLLFPSPEGLPDPAIDSGRSCFLHLQAGSLPPEPLESPDSDRISFLKHCSKLLFFLRT